MASFTSHEGIKYEVRCSSNVIRKAFHWICAVNVYVATRITRYRHKPQCKNKHRVLTVLSCAIASSFSSHAHFLHIVFTPLWCSMPPVARQTPQLMPTSSALRSRHSVDDQRQQHQSSDLNDVHTSTRGVRRIRARPGLHVHLNRAEQHLSGRLQGPKAVAHNTIDLVMWQTSDNRVCIKFVVSRESPRLSQEDSTQPTHSFTSPCFITPLGSDLPANTTRSLTQPSWRSEVTSP